MNDTDIEEAIHSAAEYGDGSCKISIRLKREGKIWNYPKV